MVSKTIRLGSSPSAPAMFRINDVSDDVEELLALERLEVGHGGYIDDAQLDASFETGLVFSSVIGLNLGKFFRPVDGFIVKDAVQLKG